MKKRIIALLVLLAMLTSSTALAAAPTFRDVPNAFWAYNEIERCYEKGIVNGVGDDSFDPKNTLTYAQFYTIIARAFYDTEVKAAAKSTDNWYSAQIRVLNGKNLLKNSASGAPAVDLSDKAISKGIPRYEMAVLMYNIAKQYGNADSWKTLRGDELNDFSRMPEYYRTAVLWCYAEGLLKGYDDNLFHGADTVNRAQACAVVCRLMDYTAGSSVTRQKVAVPTAEEGLVYNGREQVGVSCDDDDGYTLTGVCSAINARSYTATAKLKANYCWEDGTTEPKAINWSIAKAKPVANGTISVTYYVGGKMDVSGEMNVRGSFSFNTEPTGGMNRALFTPQDTQNYEPVWVNVAVTLVETIATPTVNLTD